jgi:hypothetical protein
MVTNVLTIYFKTEQKITEAQENLLIDAMNDWLKRLAAATAQVDVSDVVVNQFYSED